MTMEYMQATAEETIMFYEVWIKNE